MSKYATRGGQVTRGETFSKLLHHIREAQNQAAVMSHLHGMEGNNMDLLLAKGWLGIEELMNQIADRVTKMAMNKLQ